MSDTTHSASAHAGSEAHGDSVITYWVIGGVLTAVTVFEVFAPALLSDGLELRPGPMLIAVLMALAFVKAGLVAAFYMHLRSDSRIYTGILALAAILITYFLWLLTFGESGVGFNAGF